MGTVTAESDRGRGLEHSGYRGAPARRGQKPRRLKITNWRGLSPCRGASLARTMRQERR
jgi:hypothetical protein